MSNMMRSARNCDVCKCCMDVSTASFRQKEKAAWRAEIEIASDEAYWAEEAELLGE